MTSIPCSSAPDHRRRRWLTARLAAFLGLSLAACELRTPGPTAATDPDQPLPDFSISLEYHANGPLDDLSTVRFQVRVANGGGSTSEATTVSMYVDGQYMKDQIIYGLAGTADTTLVFSWPAAAGKHDFLFAVDRPVSGPGFVTESQEDNNTAGISLTLPYGTRVVAAQDTIPFSSLPWYVAADTLVQQILELASDSGYSVASGASMIRTGYIGAIISYHIPLVNLQAPAASAPILIINESHLLGRTQAFPYLLQVVDSTTFVFYDVHGGARVSNNGQQYLLDHLQPQPGSCSWRRLWPCVVAVGIQPILPCVLELHAAANGSTGDVVGVMAENGCASAFAAFPSTRHLLVDYPPTLYLGVTDPVDCDSCDEDDVEHDWSTWTYVFYAVDDRGPVTYLSDLVWEIPCEGGEHTFSARDNAGQTTTMNVDVELPGDYGHWVVPPPDNDCHDQGEASAMLAPFFRSMKPDGAGELAFERGGGAAEKPLCRTSREGPAGASFRLTPLAQRSGSPEPGELADNG